MELEAIVVSSAGYSGKSLVAKLGIKSGHRVHLAGAPPGFALDGLPEDVLLLGGSAGSLDVILVFVTDQKGLRGAFRRLAGRLTEAGMLWVAWPKKASKMPTDLTEDRVRDVALPEGYVDVKVCAIDETWSGLKLVKRRQLREPGAGRSKP